jgi:hypothetical protein
VISEYHVVAGLVAAKEEQAEKKRQETAAIFVLIPMAFSTSLSMQPTLTQTSFSIYH